MTSSQISWARLILDISLYCWTNPILIDPMLYNPLTDLDWQKIQFGKGYMVFIIKVLWIVRLSGLHVTWNVFKENYKLLFWTNLPIVSIVSFQHSAIMCHTKSNLSEITETLVQVITLNHVTKFGTHDNIWQMYDMCLAKGNKGMQHICIVSLCYLGLGKQMFGLAWFCWIG